MGDIILAAAASTRNAGPLLGHNSTRPASEAQLLRSFEPQQQLPLAALAVQPQGNWGCSGGMNEKNVAVAVCAVPVKGKIGGEMPPLELCRRVLQNAASARAAAEYVGGLLADGTIQGASLGVADAEQAWEIQTADGRMVAKEVDDLAALSNIFSIGADYELSAGIDSEFDFAKKYADERADLAGSAGFRRYLSLFGLMNAKLGQPKRNMLSALMGRPGDGERDKPEGIHADTAQKILSCHYAEGPAGNDLCLHGAKTCTACSLVALPALGTVWVTGSAHACRSIFKPLCLRGALPTATDERGAYRYWLQRELIARNVDSGALKKYDYDGAAAQLNAQLLELARDFYGCTAAAATQINRTVWDTESDFVNEWLEKCLPFERLPARPLRGAAARRAQNAQLAQSWAESVKD